MRNIVTGILLLLMPIAQTQPQLPRSQAPDVGARPTTPNDPLPTLDFDRYFTGRWTFEWDIPESPFGPEGKVTGTEIYKRGANGTFESDVQGTGPQGPFKSHAVITYNREAKTITRTETDSRGFTLKESGTVGADNGGAFTIYYDSEAFSYGGKQLRLKLTQTMTSPVFYRVRAQISVDGSRFMSLGFPWYSKDMNQLRVKR